jgi:hypothetical protein
VSINLKLDTDSNISKQDKKILQMDKKFLQEKIILLQKKESLLQEKENILLQKKENYVVMSKDGKWHLFVYLIHFVLY